MADAARRSRCLWALVAFVLMAGAPTIAAAQSAAVGSSSGLTLPRFVSLKSDRVNVRIGPSRDHRVAWTFVKAGLPVEVTQEFENWRRIRDSQGADGWVFHSLLSGRRTAIVAPWETSGLIDLKREKSETASLTAQMEPGVIVGVTTCDGTWCTVVVNDISGFVPQTKLWGVYEDEAFD